jgi:hypothetical protein
MPNVISAQEQLFDLEKEERLKNKEADADLLKQYSTLEEYEKKR